MSEATKLAWPAPERNKGPILEVLLRVLPASGRLLEIASGTGQHAAHFAAAMPGLVYQPSDFDPRNLDSIGAWVREAGLSNLRPPIVVDVCAPRWVDGRVEAIFCANMIHIAPPECTPALVEGAARHLAPGGRLVIYGPFLVDGQHTAESNAAFDADLRRRDARWGVRDVRDVEALARGVGLVPLERVPMPANNLTVVLGAPGPAR